jgi:iduronate 2-sulfatase
MKKILLFLFATSGITILGFKLKKEEKPNILFIVADDLRPELGTYGAMHIKSPNIDKFATSSIVFERAFCNIPVCGASRASFLSGTRPGRFRYYSAYDYLNKQFPGAKSMPRVFKENGYTTVSNGKIFHNKEDEASAWDEMWSAPSNPGADYFSPENQALIKVKGQRGNPYENIATSDLDYKDGKMALKVIEDLRKFKQSGKPFFLTMGVHKPHLPFNAPKKYWDMYDSTKIHLPDNYSQPETTPRKAFHNSGELRAYYGIPKSGDVPEAKAKKLIHGYYACVSYVDAQIGLVLDELKNSGMDKNTIVVIIGDHGWNLGDHKLWNKHTTFSSSLTAAMIIKIPQKTSGQRIKEIVEFVDIFPTLTELTHIKSPNTLNGESLVSLIEKGKSKKNFAISRWNNGWTIIKDQLYYTEWIDEKDNRTTQMLFDHKTDPLENNNVAEKPEYAASIKELALLLRKNRGKDFELDRRVTKETNSDTGDPKVRE